MIVIMLTLLTILILEIYFFERTTGNWQWEFDGGSIGSFQNKTEACIWRMFNLKEFKGHRNIYLKNEGVVA